MRFFADLHIHSRYSIATSSDMLPVEIWRWAQIKGIKLVGTGDFTHPLWFRELTRVLEPVGNGTFRLRENFKGDNVPLSCVSDTFFMLSSEISCIYRKANKTRKVHCLVYVPDFESARRIGSVLSRIGKVNSDGRPILGLDAKELLRIAVNECPSALFIPAHVWTPHFSVFGGAYGFDSLEECFEELTPHIYAIETGLSSNPVMNRQISALDHLALVSNSDAHSTSRLGREATIFECDVSYDGIASAITSGEGLAGTIEFFPEEGKYHYDGHRSCRIRLSPEDSTGESRICPVCGKTVTAGVLNRIKQLSDRKADAPYPSWAPPFHSLIALDTIIGEVLDTGRGSKKVNTLYRSMIEELGNEFFILLEASPADIESVASAAVREAISRVRLGHVHISPGFDGQYGSIRIFTDEERAQYRIKAPAHKS
ncbi:MAG TPA: endonuclease Q family protein [Syntrophorhabdaceae bacterium]|nr:endonuclease Q family protein [Syntrophorhabdaceae bacterium]